MRNDKKKEDNSKQQLKTLKITAIRNNRNQ